MPVFFVTRPVPREWVYEGSPFNFVTDGVESAAEEAKDVAGDNDVGVGGHGVAQQCIGAGLVTRWASTWCPFLSGKASDSSTTCAPGRSNS